MKSRAIAAVTPALAWLGRRGRQLGKLARRAAKPWRVYALTAYTFGGLALIGHGAGEIYAPLRTLLPGALIWIDISRRATPAKAPAKPRRKATP